MRACMRVRALGTDSQRPPAGTGPQLPPRAGLRGALSQPLSQAHQRACPAASVPRHRPLPQRPRARPGHPRPSPHCGAHEPGGPAWVRAVAPLQAPHRSGAPRHLSSVGLASLSAALEGRTCGHKRQHPLASHGCALPQGRCVCVCTYACVHVRVHTHCASLLQRTRRPTPHPGYRKNRCSEPGCRRLPVRVPVPRPDHGRGGRGGLRGRL